MRLTAPYNFVSAAGIWIAVVFHGIDALPVPAGCESVAGDERPSHAPPTNCAAEKRGVDGAAGIPVVRRAGVVDAYVGLPAPCRASTRNAFTAGQKNGTRDGSSGDSIFERSAEGVDGNIVACDPIAALCGCGSARSASTVQIGNTSMNSMRLSSPLGWKNDTAVEGMPKPTRYDQCDSLKRSRFSIGQPRATQI